MLLNPVHHIQKQSVPITKQIEYYSRVRNQMKLQLSESDLRNLQSKAIHVIIVGSNDIIDYFKPSLNISKQMNPAEFVGFMLTTIKAQLQRVYDLGGRKFMMLGLAVVGCCPQQRVKSITGDCNALANTMSLGYNNGLRSVLEQLKAQLNGFHYSYFDSYNIVQNFTQNPQLFGFKEVKSACCGLGNLNADVPCIPLSIYCPNRSDHLFWDLYHPTEAADRFVIDAAFDDKLHYTYPINLRQLVSI